MEYSSENLVILDGVSLPDGCDSKVMYWKQHSGEGCPNSISLLDIIEENAFFYRNKYLEWVHDLGMLVIDDISISDSFLSEDGDVNLWWSSLFNEKCNYSKSPAIYDLIASFALIEWLDLNKVECIKLVTRNKALGGMLKMLCEKRDVDLHFELCNVAEIPTKKPSVIEKLPNVFKGLLKIIYFSIGHWRLKGLGVDKWQKSNANILFVSYIDNLDVNFIKKNKSYKSKYWGDLHELINSSGKVANHIHIYTQDSVIRNTKDMFRAISCLNRHSKDNHVALSSFLSLKLIMKCVFTWLKMRSRSQNIYHQVVELSPEIKIFQTDWLDSFSGKTAISNILNAYLFKEAMSSLIKQEIGVYLQENQGWEFTLLKAWRAQGHSRLIGCPHSTVRFWDLRYFNHIKSYVSGSPRPDFVAVNGPMMVAKYREAEYPQNEILETEALRYAYLRSEEKKSLQKYEKDINEAVSKKTRVLILGEMSSENTEKQLRVLNQLAARGLPDYEYIFRNHPNTNLNLSEFTDLKITVSDNELITDLAACDIIFCGAVTSAAVDAYSKGLKVICWVGDELNLSPLKGFSDVSFVSCENELFRTLRDMPISYQNPVSDLFFYDYSLKRWQELLALKSTEGVIRHV